MAAGLGGAEGVRALVRNAMREEAAYSGWVRQLASILGRLHGRAGLQPSVPLRSMAELILAIGAGSALERAANPAALREEDLIAMLPRALGLPEESEGAAVEPLPRRLDGEMTAPRTRVTATATAIEQTAWERFRADLHTRMLAQLPDHLERLTWTRDRIEAAQRDGLRRLPAPAVKRSPFHERTLRGVEFVPLAAA